MKTIQQSKQIQSQSMNRGASKEKCPVSFSFSALLLLLISLCCFAMPVSAGEQVLFKGTFDPTVVSSTVLDSTHLQFNVNVIVRATPLGNAQGPAIFILDETTLTYTGQATWYTENGDSVLLTFAGTFVPTSTTSTTGIYDNVETIKVVGGTGRFEGATGTGVAGGQFDFDTGSAPAPIPFVGTISLPLSHHHHHHR
jgi:hypothetical protein